ncbi:MAG: Ldh family oxidoreductase [Rhodospirillaceae bacterium]|nr:Ldh family oxidoreductase [Rhodospirillaceae bacterium]
MSEPKRIPSGLARDAAIDILVAQGVPAVEAALVSEALIAADLRGIDTHGLACLKDYVTALQEGRIKAHPDIVTTRRFPWAARLDADNGLGPLAATLGMRAAIESAEIFGIGATGILRSNHFGAAGVYAAMAAEAGCVGIVAANASAVAAPHGANAPFLGTNPLAVAIPAGTHAPFILDMATSEGSRKKVRKALDQGVAIPSGWALGPDGQPTTDPAEALKGVMLPFGGAKGSGLSMVVDILAGVMTGAEFGGRVLSVMTNQDRESGNGHFMLAFKVSAFIDEAAFTHRMEDEIARLRALPASRGFESVCYPGERSAKERSERLAWGIPMSAALIDGLVALGGGRLLSGVGN